MPKTFDNQAAEKKDCTTGPLYIFEHTFADVQANHIKSKYFLSGPSRHDEDSKLPLVKDVFDLIKDKK